MLGAVFGGRGIALNSFPAYLIFPTSLRRACTHGTHSTPVPQGD